MSESEKTLEELVEQRTERLRADMERAREEGRRAGLREVEELLPPHDVPQWGIPDYRECMLSIRALATQPGPKLEAFEVPSAGVAGLLHSGVPLEGAHKLGTNSEDVGKALETVRRILKQRLDVVRSGIPPEQRDPAEVALDVVERSIHDLRAHAERAEADNAAKTEAFSDYVAVYGVEHEDGCPEDDTCECPLVVALNESFTDNHPGSALLKRLRTLEQESIPKARVLEVLDLLGQGAGVFGSEEYDTACRDFASEAKRRLGLDDEETRR